VKKIKSLKVLELCDSTSNELRKQASNKLRQIVGVNEVSNNNQEKNNDQTNKSAQHQKAIEN